MAERQSDETSVNRSSEDGSDVTPLSLDSLPSGVIDIIPPAQVNSQSTIDTKVADTSQIDKDKDKAPFGTNKKAGNNEPAGVKKVEITSKEIQTTSKTTDREVQTAVTTADKEVQTTVQSTPDRLSSVWMVYAVAFLSVCICLVAILVNASWGTTKINDSDSEALLKQLLSGCRLEAEGNKTIREGLKKQVEQLNKTGLDLSDELNSNKKKLKTLETLNKDLEDSKTQMRNTITELKNENQRLENRFGEALSHVAKEDSDNITQMEEHSKEKIAEEFKELYANEYTKAVIEMEKRGISVGPKKDTQFFLEILKLADDLCRNYSASHLNSIRQSITNLQIDVPSDQAKKTINVPVDDKMSKIERSKIFDIKKTAALRLLEPVTKVLTDFIATKFDVDQGKQPKLFSYIKKCVYLCWMMNIHSNPVHMKFFQPSDQTEFDSDMFRTFLTAGKYIDYIVWPPLYTFDSGKMLAKGIAEGKD